MLVAILTLAMILIVFFGVRVLFQIKAMRSPYSSLWGYSFVENLTTINSIIIVAFVVRLLGGSVDWFVVSSFLVGWVISKF